MTFNRIVDAQLDALNPRTAGRAIPRGLIRTQHAWIFFLLACAAFVLGCGGFALADHNPWPLLLCIPTLVVLCVYSYTKRFTRWSHLILGVVIAFAPVAAWIAIQPATLGAPAWLLMLAVATWIAGFDVIYACQDVEFDRSAGLHSLPARLGVRRALWVSRGLHIVTIIALIAVGWTAGLGAWYFTGVTFVAILLAYEQSLVKSYDLSRVNLAFFTINGIVGIVLGVLGVIDVVVQVSRS